jgi:hypothetical protein
VDGGSLDLAELQAFCEPSLERYKKAIPYRMALNLAVTDSAENLITNSRK